MVYEFLMALGGLGVVATTALGMLRSGHHGQSDHGGHHGGHDGGHHGSHHGALDSGAHHGGGHHGAAHHVGHSHGGHHGGHGDAAHGHAVTNGGRVDGELLAPHSGKHSPMPPPPKGMHVDHTPLIMRVLPSPIDLFALSTGAGATGYALQGALSPGQTALAAAGGAIVFLFAIVRPLFKLGTQFVTKPSEGIEGLIAKPATAISGFDLAGRGLVQTELDGQLVQLLAQLENDEIGATVTKGDQVVITFVDGAKGTCRVSREL